MRCFACDAPSSVHDSDTGREYCTSCWTVIEDTIGKSAKDEATDEELVQFLWNMQEEE